MGHKMRLVFNSACLIKVLKIVVDGKMVLDGKVVLR